MSTRSNTVTHPRGRLPARVYWVRRGLVAATALALVFGFAHLFGALGGGSGDHDSATLSADRSSASASVSATAGTPSRPPLLPAAPTTSTAPGSTPAAQLAQPDGPCSPDQLSVTPSVAHAYAGHRVGIVLKLSGSSPACTFKVSAKSLAVKITSGKDSIWSTQDCARAVKHQDVVVRSGMDTDVTVTWSGRRSDGSCSVSNKWALPGYYHVLAAVLGSTPADAQFELTVAPRAVITKTAKPKPKKKGDASASKSGGAKGNGSKCGGDNAASSC